MRFDVVQKVYISLKNYGCYDETLQMGCAKGACPSGVSSTVSYMRQCSLDSERLTLIWDINPFSKGKTSCFDCHRHAKMNRYLQNLPKRTRYYTNNENKLGQYAYHLLINNTYSEELLLYIFIRNLSMHLWCSVYHARYDNRLTMNVNKFKSRLHVMCVIAPPPCNILDHEYHDYASTPTWSILYKD